MTGYYGGLASMANTVGSAGSAVASPWLKGIFDEMAGEGGSGALGSLGAVALPALLAGGVGYATGGKYGAANAIPAALSGALGMYGDASAAKSVKDDALAQEAQRTAADVAGTKVDAASKATPAQAQAVSPAKAATAGEGKSLGEGGLGSLLSSPMGKAIAGMMLSNMFSGALQNASTGEYYDQYAKDQAAADKASMAARTGALDALYRANGGYVDSEPVTSLAPMARVERAAVRPAATPQPYQVVNPALTRAHGGPLKGKGDGMSDDIHGTIDGEEPVRVATGEYVVPKHKAEKYKGKLQSMMDHVRGAAYPQKGKQIKQDAAKRAFIHHLTGVKA